MIHGGLGREQRRKAQESFLFNPEVQVLLATDAAGEGINLQRAHLMVNYDLPWNPNRLAHPCGTWSPRRLARVTSIGGCSKSSRKRARLSVARSSTCSASSSSGAD